MIGTNIAALHESNSQEVAQAKIQANRYFEEFLPSICGQLLLEDLSGLTASFEIMVSDIEGRPWRLDIEEGVLMRVGKSDSETMCRFTLDTGTLLEVVSARSSPQEAFFEMRIEIEGDIELGLKLSTVLELFYQRFPFTA